MLMRPSLILASLFRFVFAEQNTFDTKVHNLFTCDFESGTCGVIQDGDFDWVRWSGFPPTMYTGPISGQGPSLYYFYIDCRPPVQYNEDARFATPDLNYTGDLCVDFWYEAYGATVNTLTLYVQNGSDHANHTDVWQVQGEQGNVWRRQSQTIHSSTASLRVGWSALAGTDALSSVAVDTITIFTGKCPFPIVNLPYSCNFETADVCNMTQAQTGTFQWERVSASNSSSFPYAPPGAESSEFYEILDCSSHGLPGYIAVLESPRINHTGSACVSFYYYLYGTNVADLNVFTSNLGLSSPWLTLSGVQAAWAQRTLTVYLSNDTDQVGFEGVKGVGVGGNIAIDNLQITAGDCPGDDISVIIAPPFECTFEADLCGMVEWTASAYLWTRREGPASDTLTGPYAAAQGRYYLLTDASSINLAQAAAYIQTPALAYYGAVCIEFYYSMFGSGVNQLTVYTSYQGENYPVFEIFQDQGDQWLSATLDASIGYAEKVVIVAYRGSTLLSDIALDDLRVLAGTCASQPRTTSYPVVDPGALEIFPILSCDMEGPAAYNATCALYQDPASNFEWTRGEGRTPSGALYTRLIDNVSFPVTGPEGAVVGRYYLFIEATGRFPGDIARLICNGSDFHFGPGMGCMHFYYCMNGFHTGSLRVYVSEGDQPHDVIWSVTGDRGPGWKSVSLDLSLTPFSQVGIEATTTGEFSGDTAIDNLTMNRGLCQSNWAPYQWVCNFELPDGSSTLCATHRDPGTNFAWLLWSGKTPSEETGPSQAFNGAYYLYMEASAPRVQGDTAEFLLPNISYTGTVCLAFYYHMWGFHMGTLQIYVLHSNSVQSPTLWSLSGDQGNVWIENRLTLTDFQPFDRVGFRGVRGTAFSSDIAVDNIRITTSHC